MSDFPKVRKFEITGDLLLETLRMLGAINVPNDAKFFTGYMYSPTVFGMLVDSAGYDVVEAGDLVFYAKHVELLPVSLESMRDRLNQLIAERDAKVENFNQYFDDREAEVKAVAADQPKEKSK